MRLPLEERTAWLDGRAVPVAELAIPVTDPAFHVGLGVFETIAVRGGRAIELEQHLDRLELGARRLGIELPDRELLRRTTGQAAEAEPAPYGWLKLMATRGPRWFVFTGAMQAEEEGRSIAAVLLPWRRNPRDPLAGVKTMSYAQNEIGLEEARRRGADEGLWLNTRGHLTEGCTSNLFVVHHGRVFTPGEREGLLAGVVRAVAIRAARELGLNVHEVRVRPKRLRRADEAFVTSSLCGVRPLVRVDGRPVGSGRPGPTTRAVAERVARLRGLAAAVDGREREEERDEPGE